MDKFLADELVDIGEDGLMDKAAYLAQTGGLVDIGEDGLMDKAAYLAQTGGLGPTSEPLIFSERRPRRYGDMAVSIGRMRWESEPERMAGQYMAVYVMRAGQWHPVAFQLASAPRS